jgi:glycosyltransferase involved in cell wall biosynthesis
MGGIKLFHALPPKSFEPVGTWGMVAIYLYFGSLALLCFYGLHRYLMVYLYYRHKKHPAVPPGRFEQLPFVTVQLPMYNEMYVAGRLIDAVCAMRYPRDRLEVQVLDDSTDECQSVARQAVERWQAQGVQIQYLHRDHRDGYKAGALNTGLTTARGELVAIFDADFLPQPQFLEETVHHFTDERVAVVQTRWEHLNRGTSLLTQVQAILLDGHFMIEHTARNRSGRFMNFSGTAGIWRRRAIDDAGGWTHDTLTEDLDISFRAQLKGWRFVFLPDLVTPAELPVEVNGFKTQQHRWAKGSAQTARKLLWTLLTSRQPLAVKLEGLVHLTSNSAYTLVLLMSLLMLPAVIVRAKLEWQTSAWLEALVFLAATISVCAYYIVSQREVFGGRGWLKQLKYVPMLMSVGVGLSINNARAVISGFFRRGGEFVRTPKHAVGTPEAAAAARRYRGVRPWFFSLCEFAMGCYFVAIAAYSLMHRMYGALPFQALFIVGFFYLSLLSFFQGLRARPADAPAA